MKSYCVFLVFTKTTRRLFAGGVQAIQLISVYVVMQKLRRTPGLKRQPAYLVSTKVTKTMGSVGETKYLSATVGDARKDWFTLLLNESKSKGFKKRPQGRFS